MAPGQREDPVGEVLAYAVDPHGAGQGFQQVASRSVVKQPDRDLLEEAEEGVGLPSAQVVLAVGRGPQVRGDDDYTAVAALRERAQRARGCFPPSPGAGFPAPGEDT